MFLVTRCAYCQYSMSLADFYQAERHYESALQLYQMACSFDGNKADACYNAARVLQTLASDFYDLSSSTPALEQAIELYNTAQALDPTSIDVTYNLALALAELGEWQSDKLAKASLFDEARSILEQVIAQQLESLSYAERPAEEAHEPEEPEAEDIEDSQMQEEAEEISTVVTEAVTPSDVIESLLSLVNLLSNIRSIADDTARDSISANITSAFAQARSFVTEDMPKEATAIQRAELGVALATCEQDPTAIQNIPSILAAYQSLFAANPTDMELLSEYADATSTSAELYHASNATESARLANLALSQYQQLVQSLSSPISRHGFASNLVQPTLSTAYAQCALLQLLLTNNAAAHELSLNAIQATGCGVVWQGTKFGKTEGRKDRSAWEALEFACAVFARVAFLSQRDVGQAKELLGRLKMGKRLIGLVEEEFRDDPVWNEAEAYFWAEVV